MKIRRRRAHDCPADRRAAELCAELYAQSADGHQYVRIGHVLAVLDPGHRQVPPVPPPDPRADPLTGCLPVTAEVPGGK